MEDNVISFPGYFKGAPPQSLNEIKRNTAETQKLIAEEISERSMTLVIKIMLDMGFNPLSDENFAKDLMFASEAIESLVLKTVNIGHPVQKIAKNVMVTENPSEVLESFMENLLGD